ENKIAVERDVARFVRGALRRRGGAFACLRERHSGRGAGRLRGLAGRPVARRYHDGNADHAPATVQESRKSLAVGRGRVRPDYYHFRPFAKFLALTGDVVLDRRVR